MHAELACFFICLFLPQVVASAEFLYPFLGIFARKAKVLTEIDFMMFFIAGWNANSNEPGLIMKFL